MRIRSSSDLCGWIAACVHGHASGRLGLCSLSPYRVRILWSYRRFSDLHTSPLYWWQPASQTWATASDKETHPGTYVWQRVGDNSYNDSRVFRIGEACRNPVVWNMPEYMLQGKGQVVLCSSSTEKETRYVMASLDLRTCSSDHIGECYIGMKSNILSIL